MSHLIGDEDVECGPHRPLRITIVRSLSRIVKATRGTQTENPKPIGHPLLQREIGIRSSDERKANERDSAKLQASLAVKLPHR